MSILPAIRNGSFSRRVTHDDNCDLAAVDYGNESEGQLRA
jgi:hypothetical protein